ALSGPRTSPTHRTRIPLPSRTRRDADREAEGLGGGQIDDPLELGRLFTGQLASLVSQDECARRASRGAADKVRAGDQPEERDGAPLTDTGVSTWSALRSPLDRLVDRRPGLRGGNPRHRRGRASVPACRGRAGIAVSPAPVAGEREGLLAVAAVELCGSRG